MSETRKLNVRDLESDGHPVIGVYIRTVEDTVLYKDADDVIRSAPQDCVQIEPTPVTVTWTPIDNPPHNALRDAVARGVAENGVIVEISAKEEPVITIVTSDPGAAYTLRLPDGQETTVYDGEDDYWAIANVIDARFPTPGNEIVRTGTYNHGPQDDDNA